MDSDLIVKLIKACLEHNVPLGMRKKQATDIVVSFSEKFILSKEFDDICSENNISPGEIILKVKQGSKNQGSTSPLYISKDIVPEYLLLPINNLKRNVAATSCCLSDLLEVWSEDKSGKLKKHHKLSEKMLRGYLKLRGSEHPDESRNISHEDIRTAIKNYQLWAKVASNNSKVWFQKWDLDSFLRSNKAVSEWCYDLKEMKAKVGDQYFDGEIEEEDDIDPEVLDKSRLSHLRDLRETIDRGEKLTPEWQGFWDQYHHLLDGQS